MNKIFRFACCILLLSITVTFGTASAFTIDFTKTPDIGTNKWNAAHGGAVTVYAYLTYNGGYPATLVKSANGLGVQSGGESKYLDGKNPNNYREFLRFDFLEEVTVTGISFYGFDKNDHFDFYAGSTKVLSGRANVADVALNNYTSTWFQLFTKDKKDEYYLKSLTIADPASPVPEPTTFLLLGAGLAGIGAYSRKRAKK